jgi:hypothetical protein
VGSSAVEALDREASKVDTERVTEVERFDDVDEDDDEGLGAGFYFKIAGICLAIAVAAIIFMRIWWRATYAWGFFGAFIALGIVLALFGWVYDRRNPRVRD